MPILDPKFLSFLPTFPIPFKKKDGSGKHMQSKCYLLDTKTGAKFKFEFNLGVEFNKSDEFKYHKGILNNHVTPIFSGTGVSSWRFNSLIFKMDKNYDIANVTTAFRKMAQVRHGKKRVIKFVSAWIQIKGYIRDISINWVRDYVENEVPRQAEISFTMIPYFKLPKPKSGGAPDTQSSSFFTSKSDTTKKGSSSSSKDVAHKFLDDQNAMSNTPPAGEADPGQTKP